MLIPNIESALNSKIIFEGFQDFFNSSLRKYKYGSLPSTTTNSNVHISTDYKFLVTIQYSSIRSINYPIRSK